MAFTMYRLPICGFAEEHLKWSIGIPRRDHVLLLLEDVDVHGIGYAISKECVMT
jgi:hypothetical protein